MRETRLLLESLKKERPARYGLLENNFEDVYDAVAGSKLNYPCSRNLHEDEFGLERCSFGQALSQLEELGVFESYNGDVSGVKRYDFSSLNRERLEILYEEFRD